MAEQKIITKKWTLEEIDLLINLIRENPELYEGCYQRIEVVEKCWQAIADAIQTKNGKNNLYSYSALSVNNITLKVI